MLMPKRVKRRRQMRGRMKGNANKGNRIAYGEYGLVAAEPCWITSNQIEAARVGSGNGSPEYWVAVVKPGRVMFEMAGVSEDVAREALRLASAKLPIKCKIYNKAQLEAKLAEKEGGEAK